MDRAALYLFAGPEARDTVRRELETRAAVQAVALPALDAQSRALLLALARTGTLGGLAVSLGLALRIPPIRHLSLDDEAEAELFALCLVAVGLEPEDCVRVFLTAEPTLARSVDRVFHLVAVCRTTSRGAATALVRAALLDGGAVGAAGFRAGERGRHAVATGNQGRGRGARHDLSAPSASPAERDRETSGRADHRATATRGRDRT